MDLPISWLTPLFIVLGLTLIPYVLGPLLIRFTLRQSADPEVDTFDPDDPDLPDVVDRHFRKVTKTLRPLGFEVVEGLALPNQTPRVKALVLMYANRTEKDAAIAAVMYAKAPDGTKLQTAYVEIISRYRDGTLVQTNNSSQLGAFKARPGVTTTQFPTVRDAARLYRLHQALAEQHGGSRKSLRLDEEFHGDAVAYLTWALVDELDGQIDTGYMYLSPQERLYRPTWKGAFLMTWGQLWTFKAIRQQRRAARARRLIDELEG